MRGDQNAPGTVFWRAAPCRTGCPVVPVHQPVVVCEAALDFGDSTLLPVSCRAIYRNNVGPDNTPAHTALSAQQVLSKSSLTPCPCPTLPTHPISPERLLFAFAFFYFMWLVPWLGINPGRSADSTEA